MRLHLLILFAATAILTGPFPSLGQDRLGDPLPDGALQRLGTTRLRGRIADLCYLPDGRGILVSGRSVEIWDLAEGELQERNRVTESTLVSAVLRGDGKALLLADRSGSVLEWDVVGKGVLQSWSTNQSRLSRAHYSPDGTRVLTTGSRPPTLKEWELASTRELVAITGRMHTFREGIYGPEGRTALVGGSAGSGPILAHYSLSSGELLNEWFKDYTAYSRTIELSHDGTRVLVGSRHRATEWLLDGYQRLGEYTGHHGHAVTSLAYCVDPDQILTGSRDGSIRRWNRQENKALLRWVPHADDVRRIAVSPEGKWVLSYGNGIVAETSLETGEPRLQWDRHRQAVQAATFMPDGRHVVSGSSDGTLRVWDVETGACLRTISGANLGAYAVAVSPDGSTIAAGCKDGIVREFGFKDGMLIRELKGHRGYVRAMAYTPDGTRLLSSADDGSIRAWAAGDPDATSIYHGHHGGVLSIAVSGNGKHLLSGGRDGTVRLWDLETAGLLKTMEGHRSWVEAVAFSGKDKDAVSAGADSRLLRWDLGTGQIASEMIHNGRVNALVCDPNGTRAYSGGEDRGVACWDMTSGSLVREMSGHGRAVQALALSPDGKTVVTASDDTTLLVWQVPERR
ncbi:MAG: WD40 repeat domain-containing protein [Candidatus Latescibacteria bacterium]|jgi:WD40 repeat protein|nr:WD40 repeat domain-containing protein [Candidatus Latescibacterota bacterium]